MRCGGNDDATPSDAGDRDAGSMAMAPDAGEAQDAGGLDAARDAGMPDADVDDDAGPGQLEKDAGPDASADAAPPPPAPLTSFDPPARGFTGTLTLKLTAAVAGDQGYVQLAADASGFQSNLPVLVISMLGDDPPDPDVREYVPMLFMQFEPKDGRTTVNGPATHSSRPGIKLRGRSTRNQPKHS